MVRICQVLHPRRLNLLGLARDLLADYGAPLRRTALRFISKDNQTNNGRLEGIRPEQISWLAGWKTRRSRIVD
jgi:hypothetical protein